MTPKEKALKRREYVIHDWMRHEYAANGTTILARLFELLEAAERIQKCLEASKHLVFDDGLKNEIAAVKAALPEELR
jgi:hypothetical protein